MILTLQLDTPLAVRLQTQATIQKVSLAEFVHQFLDTHWGEIKQKNEPELEPFEQEWSDDDWDEWSSDEWIYNETSNSKQQNHIQNDGAYWEQVYTELRDSDPDHEAEIDRKYGKGIEILHNSSGLIDTGLPVEEIRYILESPNLSQQSIWAETDRTAS